MHDEHMYGTSHGHVLCKTALPSSSRCPHACEAMADWDASLVTDGCRR